MKSKKSGRRRFLKDGAALAALAVGGIRTASGQQNMTPELIHLTGVRPLGERSSYEKLVRSGTAIEGIRWGLTPLQDLQGIITPSALHYYVNHERGLLPKFNPEQYRLMIHGMVDRPLVFTLAELKRLPSISRIYFLECTANSGPRFTSAMKTVQEIHGRTSCSEWTGVPLSVLLKEAGVRNGASWIVAGSADTSKHASSIPMEKAMDDALVAYGQNGEALRLENGYPLRLLLPGYGGMIAVKWLNQIKAVDQPYMTTQDRHSHADHSPAGEGAFLMTSDVTRRWHFGVHVKSVITFPSGGQQLSGRGFYEITGLAWSGGGAVRRVEVSTDGGRTWKDAQLQEPVLRFAHTRFRFPWRWNGEETVLMSRCTDENGDVQAAADEVEKHWGADTSDACRDVLGDECNHVPRRVHRAYIQPWRVARDGSVHNAFVPGRNPTELISNQESG